jgi:hypothetical protein
MSPINKATCLGCLLRVALALSLLNVAAAAQTTVSSPPSKSTVAPIEVRVEKMKEKRDARRREVIVFDKPREGCPLWRFEMLSDANGRIVFQVNEPVEPNIVKRDVQRSNEFEMILGDNTCRFRIRIEPSE